MDQSVREVLLREVQAGWDDAALQTAFWADESRQRYDVRNQAVNQHQWQTDRVEVDCSCQGCMTACLAGLYRQIFLPGQI